MMEKQSAISNQQLDLKEQIKTLLIENGWSHWECVRWWKNGEKHSIEDAAFIQLAALQAANRELREALRKMSVEFNWMLLSGEYNDNRNAIANEAARLLSADAQTQNA